MWSAHIGEPRAAAARLGDTVTPEPMARTLRISIASALALGACEPGKTTSPATEAPASSDASKPEPASEPPPQTTKVRPVPDGFFAITPQLIVTDVDHTIDFCQKAFAAEKIFTSAGPTGKSNHGEIRIGDSIVIVEEENPGDNVKSPLTLG